MLHNQLLAVGELCKWLIDNCRNLDKPSLVCTDTDSLCFFLPKSFSSWECFRVTSAEFSWYPRSCFSISIFMVCRYSTSYTIHSKGKINLWDYSIQACNVPWVSDEVMLIQKLNTDTDGFLEDMMNSNKWVQKISSMSGGWADLLHGFQRFYLLGKVVRKLLHLLLVAHVLQAELVLIHHVQLLQPHLQLQHVLSLQQRQEHRVGLF